MTRAGRSLSERLMAACDDNDEQMASVRRMLDERDREEAGAWMKQDIDIDLDPAEQQLLFSRQQGLHPALQSRRLVGGRGDQAGSLRGPRELIKRGL